MPNIAAVLKEEIRRLAKSEIKANTSSTKRAVVQYRRDIAALKRQLRAQEQAIAWLKSLDHRRPGEPQLAAEPREKTRFSARSVRAQRSRLKLSAAAFGKLVGVSGLTVYSWEHQKRRPKKAHLAALAAVRQIPRREALAKLEAMSAARTTKSLRRRKPR